MDIAQLHELFLASTGVCTDTRKLGRDNLFFALSGDNFDGNTFAKIALEQGAAYAVIDNRAYQTAKTILVEDTLKTLQELATYHRQFLGIPVIALTGSNGKTTTKELINAVLSKKFKTSATEGNLNNHIGVPLTLLKMNQQTELGIVEMGANHQKEIAQLSRIAQPDFGYITNFGKAHLEGFGGVEGVIKGKSELYDYLRDHSKIAFINADDPLQVNKATGIRQITFSKDDNAHFKIDVLGATPFVQLSTQGVTINSQLIGAYNGTNAAAAVAMGLYFEIAPTAIKEGIEAYLPRNNRSQIIKRKGITVILDAYNANPTSTEAAIQNLAAQKSTYKMAFLGDMFEVGATTIDEHLNILSLTEQLGIDQVFAVGKAYYKAGKQLEYAKVFESYDAFAKAYIHTPKADTTILIKGSRGMRMERVLDLLAQ